MPDRSMSVPLRVRQAAEPVKFNSATAVIVAVFLGVFGFQVAHYYPFFSDDALISLRYSQRLLAGHGLTWTDGTPVEGYTNLLWVLGVALFGGLGLDLVTAARILGLLAVGVTAWAIFRAPASG